jgi:signal transduction histidine kinase
MNAHILIVDDESRVTSALQRTLPYECYTVSTADTFNAMLVNLKEAYERQQRFIADASHELGAPITSIRCNLDLLAKAPDLPTEEVQASLSDTRTEAQRMGRLLSDLLLLAPTEATEQARQADHSGTNDYRNVQGQEVDLDSLLLEVFRQYRPGGEDGICDKALGPRWLLQHISPAQVYGDADQLKQALVVPEVGDHDSAFPGTRCMGALVRACQPVYTCGSRGANAHPLPRRSSQIRSAETMALDE